MVHTLFESKNKDPESEQETYDKIQDNLTQTHYDILFQDHTNMML